MHGSAVHGRCNELRGGIAKQRGIEGMLLLIPPSRLDLDGQRIPQPVLVRFDIPKSAMRQQRFTHHQIDAFCGFAVWG
ncbi:hypothetical protein D3C71_1271110 [compost metagenome]